VHRILIFGNSGSGKSTMAHTLVKEYGLAHLDLDSLAWDSPGVRRPLAESLATVEAFLARNGDWVIEGCYADLFEPVLAAASEVRFLNPGVEVCIAHCRARPWEPQKYASKAEQDERLSFLSDWVRQYETRTDEYSLQAHRRLFERFAGPKREYT
jgi:adenylate kinase family enzyme